MADILDKKKILTEMLDSINKDINLISVMIIKTNGNLLANNFPETAINYIKNIIKKYKDIQINNYIKANVSENLNLVLFKISLNIFLICLTRENEKIIIKKFRVITDKYNYILNDLFTNGNLKVKTKKSKYIKYIVYSKASDLGPTPIAWIPESLKEQEKFEIAAKSILVLSAGFDQTSSSNMDQTTSIIPFINLNCIGLVYIFLIPSPQARGNSYDASITVLIPIQHKKILLKRLERLEMEIKEITKQIIIGRNPKNLLKILKERLEQIMEEKREAPQIQEIDHSIKNLMLSEIKKIQDKKPYSTAKIYE